MSWVMAAMAGVGMLKGAANERKMEREKRMKAELAKFSPWSDMAGNKAESEDTELPDALSMGLQGAALGAMAKGAMAQGPAKSPDFETPGSPMQQYPGANMLGGQDMVNQFGAFNPYTNEALKMPRFGTVK